MFDRIFDSTFSLLKASILVAAIFIALTLYIVKKQKLESVEKKLNYILGTLAILSFAAFYNFGNMHFGGGKYHTHDLYHYYMGSKYFKEVGYLYLYDATVTADKEFGGKLSGKVVTVRDQSTYNHRPISTIETTKPLWQPKFTEKRWDEFKKDLRWFQAHPHGVEWWKGIVSDFGYNPTPGWTMDAQILSHLIPTSFELGMLFIAYLDGILAIIMFVLIYKAFGRQTMFFSMIYWGCTFTFVFSFTGASMLRHDWICYIVYAMCLLKMAKPKLSAFFLAAAAILRILPGLFFIPLVLGYIMRSYKNRKQNNATFKYITYYTVAFLLLFSVSLVTVSGGITAWKDWKTKMHVHETSWNTWNWGFVDIFVYGGETKDNLRPNWKDIGMERLKDLSALILVIRVAMVCLLAYACARLRDWETIALGGVLFFMFFNPTKYYFVHLITLLPLFASRLQDLWRVVGVCLLFLLTIVMHTINSFNETAIMLQFVFCTQIFIFYVIVMLLITREKEVAIGQQEAR